MNDTLDFTTALLRNGTLIERARLEGRSLTPVERAIIIAGRNIASDNRLTRRMMNAIEMEGERDKTIVMAPLKVEAQFAYYDEPYEEIPAKPYYIIHRSNHPPLAVGSHIDPSQLTECGQKVPKTPTYEKWVKQGKEVLREVKP